MAVNFLLESYRWICMQFIFNLLNKTGFTGKARFGSADCFGIALKFKAAG